MNIRNLVVLPALCALGTGAAAAQFEPAAGSAPDASRPGRLEYRSVFTDYRAYRDPTIADWRSSNDEVGRLKGHGGHLGGGTVSEIAPSAEQPVSARPKHTHGGGVR